MIDGADELEMSCLQSPVVLHGDFHSSTCKGFWYICVQFNREKKRHYFRKKATTSYKNMTCDVFVSDMWSNY